MWKLGFRNSEYNSASKITYEFNNILKVRCKKLADEGGEAGLQYFLASTETPSAAYLGSDPGIDKYLPFFSMILILIHVVLGGLGVT